MPDKVNIKRLVGNIAKRSRTRGLTTLAFKNKVKSALQEGGFSQKKAGRIATSLKSGSTELTAKESAKVIKVLKKAKVLKGQIKDIRGEVSDFLKADRGRSGESQQSERAKKAEIRRRLRERSREDEENIKASRGPKGAKPSKNNKSSNGQSSAALSSGYIGAETEVIKSSPRQMFEPRIDEPKEAFLPQKDKEIESLVSEAEEQDLPLD